MRDNITEIMYQQMTLAPTSDAASISVPLVDHLLVELETRFSPRPRVALLGFCLVPSALVTLSDPDVKSHLAKLVDLYEEDLASPESVSHQMVSWKIK